MKNQTENNQEYYNTIMTKKLADRIIELRDIGVKWKDLVDYIKKEFGSKYALEDNVITGMYLEYAANDLIMNRKRL